MKTLFDGMKKFIPKREGYYRSRLTSAEQKIYDLVYDHLLVMDGEITCERIRIPYDDDCMKNVLSAIRMDQPCFFYFSKYSYVCTFSGKHQNLKSIHLHYQCSKSEAEQMIRMMDRKLNEMCSDSAVLRNRMNPEKTSLILHDRLASMCSYVETGWRSHCAVGALIDGQAVCQGVSDAYKLLMNAAGAGCINCYGTLRDGSSDGGHAWNMVLISGRHYYVDVTSDLKKRGFISHRHALMNRRDAAAYHEDHSYGITLAEDNYFTRNSLVCRTESQLKTMLKASFGKPMECLLTFPVGMIDTVVGKAVSEWSRVTYEYSFDKNNGYLYIYAS